MLNDKVHFGRRAPFGSAILGLLGGHSCMVRREPCSSTPQNRMPILRQPIPLGGLGLRRFCETRGREKSVCNYDFTHVTHVVKLFMRVKYNSLYVFHTLYITNKTYFRIRALFHILVLLRVDPKRPATKRRCRVRGVGDIFAASGGSSQDSGEHDTTDRQRGCWRNPGDSGNQS